MLERLNQKDKLTLRLITLSSVIRILEGSRIVAIIVAAFGLTGSRNSLTMEEFRGGLEILRPSDIAVASSLSV